MIFLIFMAAMTATVTTGLLPKEKPVIIEKTILVETPRQTGANKPRPSAKKRICKEWSK
jgi:hypothetical protein